MNDEICIPTYILKLPKRIDRLAHIRSQFEGKDEFEINVIDAPEHPIDAVALWQSICRVIKIAIEREEDVIILCEDNHEFTPDNDRKKLIEAIYVVHLLNVIFLIGGINGGLTIVLTMPIGLFWLDTFWGKHFVVVFSSFYDIILNEPFLDEDAADLKFSEMTSNKFVMYLMIAKQKEFGYSDITELEHTGNYHSYLHTSTTLKLDKVNAVYQKAMLYQSNS